MEKLHTQKEETRGSEKYNKHNVERMRRTQPRRGKGKEGETRTTKFIYISKILLCPNHLLKTRVQQPLGSNTAKETRHDEPKTGQKEGIDRSINQPTCAPMRNGLLTPYPVRLSESSVAAFPSGSISTASPMSSFERASSLHASWFGRGGWGSGANINILCIILLAPCSCFALAFVIR